MTVSNNTTTTTTPPAPAYFHLSVLQVIVLRRAVNGSVRVVAHDPETCDDYTVTIDHYDTSSLTAAVPDADRPAAASAAYLSDAQLGKYMLRGGDAQARSAVFLCDRLKMDRLDLGLGPLTIFPWEKDETCTKIRKAFLGLDRDADGCVRHDDVMQMMQLTTVEVGRLLRGGVSAGNASNSLLPEELAKATAAAAQFLEGVARALRRHPTSQVSFEDFLGALDASASAAVAPGGGR